jgi:hypothetical protein
MQTHAAMTGKPFARNCFDKDVASPLFFYFFASWKHAALCTLTIACRADHLAKPAQQAMLLSLLLLLRHVGQCR